MRPISEVDAPASIVADKYFRDSADPQSIVADEGTAAPLVDEVWESLRSAEEIGSGSFVRLCAELMRERIDFALWCGNDFEDLPLVRTERELTDALRVQAAAQPADVFLWFSAQ